MEDVYEAWHELTHLTLNYYNNMENMQVLPFLASVIGLWCPLDYFHVLTCNEKPTLNMHR